MALAPQRNSSAVIRSLRASFIIGESHTPKYAFENPPDQTAALDEPVGQHPCSRTRYYPPSRKRPGWPLGSEKEVQEVTHIKHNPRQKAGSEMVLSFFAYFKSLLQPILQERSLRTPPPFKPRMAYGAFPPQSRSIVSLSIR